MKKFLLLAFLTVYGVIVNAQSIDDSFFTKVSYMGAFNTEDWTEGWANFDPQNTTYDTPTETVGNGVFTYDGGTQISSDESWSGVLKLDGWVYVKDGATLTIEEGTVIRGTAQSCLIVERGGKIMAEGTADSPIVFTSMNAAGYRASSDWAGVILCGKAPNNKGTDVTIEGGVGAQFGGSDETDNSGVLSYVRIEFPGYDLDGTGNEINGLTMGGVGSGTSIDHIQVSYSGDDSYEWFGGTVNAKYLIAYSTEDDDFDTDYGYSGHVQFAVCVRNPDLSDTDSARGFESDNDGDGSDAEPYTSVVFSNVTLYGPNEDNSTNGNHDVGLKLRRNTKLQLYNSVVLGFVKQALNIDGTATQAGAEAGDLKIKNTFLATDQGNYFKAGDTGWTYADYASWFMAEDYENDTLGISDLKLTYPLTLTDPDFIPEEDSPLLEKSSWGVAQGTTASIESYFFDHVSYIGAFDTEDWTEGWANFDPQNTTYDTPTETVGNGVFTYDGGTQISSDESWSGVLKLDGWVYVKDGATLTIEEGTVIRGTAQSCLIVERGGKIMAEGTADSPIVFTSMNAAGYRASSDWAGVILCGKAPNNKGTDVTIEGGVGAQFGGSDETDNSGVLSYVRIEFPGYDLDGTGNEINGLTMGGVGSGTSIDHIQVSYSGDDSYEWFGGTVNAKYLIAYSTEDDDFDTDYGYSGHVQFAVCVRNPDLSDTDSARGFESDNDGDGSDAEPYTSVVFSNVTLYGPNEDNSTNGNHDVGLKLRRNTKLQLYNSVVLGFVKQALNIDGTATQAGAEAGDLKIKNTFLATDQGNYFKAGDTGWTYADYASWFMAEDYENDTLGISDLKLTYPLTLTDPDFIPEENSPVYNASYWYLTTSSPIITQNNFAVKSYPNPFTGATNIELELQENANVRIVIFNMSGNIVSDLQNGKLSQGIYNFTFDASQLPAGMYFGKVIIGNESYSLKLIAQ